jgi:ParB family chromosome partitioning protein
LRLEQLTAFANHPFHVLQDDEMQRLMNSIRENGVLMPAVARPKGDGYELISGHRRKAACELLGLETMPVLVRVMTDEQAIIAMVDSNVQRENLLPSEKAFAYKMKSEAMKHQGKATSTQVAQKLSVARIGEEAGESKDQVRRFIRLTELIPRLLQMVDDKKIAFNPAVELSYLTQEEQTLLLSTMESEQATPSLAQAQRLKQRSGEGTLDEPAMLSLLREPKANQKEQVRLPCDKLKAYFPKNYTVEQMEKEILKLLESRKAHTRTRRCTIIELQGIFMALDFAHWTALFLRGILWSSARELSGCYL